MIAGVIIKNINKYEDERGWLMEVFRSDELDDFKPAMAYVSLTKPGVIRGPHEHVNQTDAFIFSGPGNFSLHLWDRRDGSLTRDEKMEFEVGAANPCLVIVPPGVVHAYKCISEEAAQSINLPNKLYKGKGKRETVDEIRWENNLDSPYKIK
ncbi:MAG: dTDP-4-dehydrorhamnose 3,5-epimerase family protein [Candidatus Falkowbacteria bacterium]|nr:dTDP-4-dehydrorhamnose 3,5-epimerase family protein [Candidatus Falkowbacteria bacterium]